LTKSFSFSRSVVGPPLSYASEIFPCFCFLMLFTQTACRPGSLRPHLIPFFGIVLRQGVNHDVFNLVRLCLVCSFLDLLLSSFPLSRPRYFSHEEFKLIYTAFYHLDAPFFLHDDRRFRLSFSRSRVWVRDRIDAPFLG